MRKFLVLLLLLWIARLPAVAGPDDPSPRPLIRIAFELKTYAADYAGTKKTDLEAWVAEELAEHFGDRYRFVDFTAQTPPEDVPAHLLSISIQKDTATQVASFHIEIPDLNAEAAVRWQFRGADQHHKSVGNAVDLRGEILDTFSRRHDDNAEELVATCLSCVRLSAEAHHLSDDFVILPLRCDDFKIHESESEFRIHAQVKFDGIPVTSTEHYKAVAKGKSEKGEGVPEDYEDCIVARITGMWKPGESMKDLGGARVTVTSVSVGKYLKSGCAAVTPDELVLSEEE